MQRDLNASSNDVGGSSMTAGERAAAVSAAAAAIVGDPLKSLVYPANGGAAAAANVASANAAAAPSAPRGGGISHSVMPRLNSNINNSSNVSVAAVSNRTSSHPSLATLAPVHSRPEPPSHQQEHQPPHLLSPDAVRCVTCGFAGSDLRIKGSCGCAYHARCIDLVGLCNAAHQQQQRQQQRSGNDNIVITVCPNCNGAADGLEIVPLSFAEMDRGHRVGTGKRGGANNNVGANNSTATGDMSRKRSSNDLASGGGGPSSSSSYPSNVSMACRATNNVGSGVGNDRSFPSSAFNPSSVSSSSCYDPAVPRTGRWTDEELAFRDAVIARFLDGSLPLSNGLKLNDFLSNMLKSKQSRLTKKMKHAKLSTKYFRIKTGYVTPVERARELSSLEHDFVNVVADPVERSEIQFHMQKEWRDHLAERCTYLRIQFDAEEWLRSVDAMDRRVALEKNRSRMVKRRCLMGKAMEKDVSESLPGVFINQVVDRRTEDFLHDMEVKSKQVRSPSLGGLGGGNQGGKSGNSDEGKNNNEGKNNDEEDGDFGRFLMSMLDEAPIAMAHAAVGGGHPSQAHLGGAGHHHPSPGPKKAAVRSSYCDPNFRYAAPFLAGITSYMERNGVPFEHVDIWVPSTVPAALEGEGSMGSAPVIGEMGSGSSSNLADMGDGGGLVCRLCFAGSATLGTQIIDEPAATSADVSYKNGAESEKKTETITVARTIVPLSGDEIFNFSLYGDYSEKFSFSSGCGLPGRVFSTGVAAWEQFLANAPPEMFERRGGAIQFGIRTALGLPIESPNVGRIVLVLYSKHNREKDEELVNRMVRDVRLFNPCPRWKLVVDVRSQSGGGVGASPVAARPPAPSPPPLVGMTGSTSFNAGMSALSMKPSTPLGMDLAGETTPGNQHTPQNPMNGKNGQIINLISLLQENMPSDQSSPLHKQLNSIMSLRMTLLRPNRSPEEEQLVDTVLVLFESYVAAGRTRSDIALLVTRDYDFHTQHQACVAMLTEPGPMGTVQQGRQQQHLQQPAMHSFGQPGSLGGMSGIASSAGSAGSFLPAPLAPPQQQPFVGGLNGGGGTLPMLQNVVHPYTLPGLPGGGGAQPIDIAMQHAMLMNARPSSGSMPSPKPNEASES